MSVDDTEAEALRLLLGKFIVLMLQRRYEEVREEMVVLAEHLEFPDCRPRLALGEQATAIVAAASPTCDPCLKDDHNDCVGFTDGECACCDRECMDLRHPPCEEDIPGSC